MSGLIYRDIITYLRRSFRVNALTDVLFFILFLFPLGKFSFSPFSYLLLYLPTQMCGVPMILKEADTSYKGAMLSMTLPFTKKELVRSRYFSCCLYHIYGFSVALLFMLLHFLIYHSYSLTIYLGILAGSYLITLFMTLINIMVCYLGNVNVSTFFYIVFILICVCIYVLCLWLDFDLKDLIFLPVPLLWAGAAGLVFLTGVLSYNVSQKIFTRNGH